MWIDGSVIEISDTTKCYLTECIVNFSQSDGTHCFICGSFNSIGNVDCGRSVIFEIVFFAATV